jgi:hypothetical protein
LPKIIIDGGGEMKVSLRHVRVFFNGKKTVDTTINNNDLHPGIGKIISCFKIDTTLKNRLIVDVNSKKVEVDIGNYDSKCINFHVAYDDVTKISEIIKKAQNGAYEVGKKFDSRKFADSLVSANPNDKLDTIICRVDLMNCTCAPPD